MIVPARGPDWMLRGLCREVGMDLFFPEKGENGNPAKRVCARCDVRPECRAYGLANGELFGVWGGLSVPDRQRIWAAERQTAEEAAAAEEVAA